MAQNRFEGFVENLDVDYTCAFIAEYAEEGGRYSLRNVPISNGRRTTSSRISKGLKKVGYKKTDVSFNIRFFLLFDNPLLQRNITMLFSRIASDFRVCHIQGLDQLLTRLRW